MRPRESFRETMSRLSAAQKGAARGAPAYSRFVNRKIGRVLAAGAYQAGLTPNAVTAVSALFTFTGIGLLVALPPSWGLGAAVTALLVLGYAWDSADGQVARLSGLSSPAGEWLDHVVDAVKVVSLPLALGLGFYRYDVVPEAWLLVPLVSAVVSSALFFAMILTEQLRRAHGVESKAVTGGRMPWLRSVLMLPTDYGVLCWVFVLLGAPTAFFAVYTVITACTALFLLLAAVRWFREMGRL
ncbi:CDP-alcohol phosphatidyltransferase family protein [Myceligenerans pegani]|uniref:CDP-alcohol phosphatidyltransferase family protein n=1 Tax=Myceligenerans pegani TaxID=2776917 RepID=A0ABR9MTU1_9MICO|nr:CDP-alcohol phosphatidyltransferase family protein [Myceligenerans sp. TRM 65318]MBE1874788.1 CDP-alcohol phosphatidyltransferase family protein [Myceligenerans sp. TRM 65318]MBE3017059.1 CDP-alcohol phosphatidyltransferase family protein [Myceligenerans sp. TRM 65318]